MMTVKVPLSGLFLALGVVFAAHAADSVLPDAGEKAREYYRLGKKAIEQGNYAQANELFSKAELALSRSAPAAAEDSASLLGAGPLENPPDFYFNLGVEFLRNGNFLAAEEAFVKVVALRPDDAPACYNLGVLYENYLDRPQEAVKYYLRYVNLAPDAADADQVRSWVETLQAEGRNDGRF